MTEPGHAARELIRQAAAEVISMSPERVARAAETLDAAAIEVRRSADHRLAEELQNLRRHLAYALRLFADLAEIGTADNLIYSPSGVPEPRATAEVQVHG